MDVSFKLTIIMECSQIINESDNINKAPILSNASFLNLFNLFVRRIIEKQVFKKKEQDRNP